MDEGQDLPDFAAAAGSSSSQWRASASEPEVPTRTAAAAATPASRPSFHSLCGWFGFIWLAAIYGFQFGKRSSTCERSAESGQLSRVHYLSASHFQFIARLP